MGVNIETIFDIADDNTKQTPDLEKWKNFLDQMGIEYQIEDGFNEYAEKNTKEYISLKVISGYEKETSLYVQEVEVKFNLDQSFRCIECIGD